MATHALRPYLTTFLFSNSPPPLATHAFNDSSSSTTFLLSNFPPPLGNPCFATLPDNIPFIKFAPPPWKPMLSMIQVQVQHSFYQIFPPPPLATHALRPYLTTFLLSNFSPPLETHAFNDSRFKYNIPFIKFFPPLATHALRPYLTTFLLSNFPPPLGNPCFQ